MRASNLRLILWMAPLLLFLQTEAQTKRTVSAKEAVELALQQVNDLKNLKLDYEAQRAKNKEIEGSAYPQINGTISTQHFFAIPTQVLPDFISPSVYGVLNKEGVKDGNGNPIQMPGSFGSIPAQFGVPWQASAGFTVQQLLFQADVFVGLKARKTAMDYASANIRVGEDKVRENVLNAYYAVLVAQKQQYFVNESKKRLEKLLHDVTEMYKNGFVEKLDIEKTQVTLNNLSTTKAQLDNLLQIGYANLKLQIGIPQADTLELTTPLSATEVKEEILSDESFRYEDRNEILALNKVKKLLELDVQRNQLGRIPTIAAYWNYSRNALRQDFNFFKSGTAYPWFPTSIVGVNINVPIFSGFARDQKIKQAKIALEKHNNTINTVQQSIDLQKLAAKKNLITNVEQMDAAEKNMQLAQNVYNTTKKKYEQGIGSSFEVLTADTELQTAQGNYFSALYNAVLAKIAYMRALGKLN